MDKKTECDIERIAELVAKYATSPHSREGWSEEAFYNNVLSVVKHNVSKLIDTVKESFPLVQLNAPFEVADYSFVLGSLPAIQDKNPFLMN